MKVVPYSRSPDEEFPNNPKTIAYKWSSRRQRVYGGTKGAERLLGDAIKVRQDTKDYGFVFNPETGMVFYADHEATKVLSQNLKTPLAEMLHSEPDLLKNLGLI